MMMILEIVVIDLKNELSTCCCVDNYFGMRIIILVSFLLERNRLSIS